MFCRTCGKPLDDSLKFCPNCGERVDGKDEVNNPKDPRTMIINQKTHDYLEDLRKGFNCFISYISCNIITIFCFLIGFADFMKFVVNFIFAF